MTLTEKWKKGELEDGFYYVEEDGKTFISICRKHYLLQVLQDCKVLAPVPSYEEYSRLEWYAGCGPDRIVELNKENRQLRKWCEEFNALDVAKENEALKTKLSIQCEANEELRRACKMRDKIIKKYEGIDDWWKAENQQLKELLKECRHIMNIEKDFASCHFEKQKLDELLTKIDNVIGEKK